MEINIETVKELIDALGRAGVDKLSLETQEFKLSLEKSAAVCQAPVGVRQAQAAEPALDRPAPEATQEKPTGNVVTSPIVGTFYASSSPEKPPFVKVGQQVKKGDTLFIVESMKLMNEITSEFDGEIAEIFVESGKGLEYGQPVMRIK
jgi:acetyl-CoA carboxylase biotin carboxyl carrier protein